MVETDADGKTTKRTMIYAPDGFQGFETPVIQRNDFNKNSNDTPYNPDYFEYIITPTTYEKYGSGDKESKWGSQLYMHLLDRHPTNKTPSPADLPYDGGTINKIQQAIDENTAPKLPPVETPAQDTSKAIQA